MTRCREGQGLVAPLLPVLISTGTCLHFYYRQGNGPEGEQGAAQKLRYRILQFHEAVLT